MTEEDWIPRELRVPAGRDALVLDWPDGACTLTAARLRMACRCSACVAADQNGHPRPAPPAITIGGVRPVGRYAVNIGFSDGHERGVYVLLPAGTRGMSTHGTATHVVETDLLVIVGGTAGPMAAIKAKEKDPAFRVVLMEKANVKRSGAIAMGMDSVNNAVIPGHAAPANAILAQQSPMTGSSISRW